MKRWLAGVITIGATFLLTLLFVYVVSVALEQSNDAVRLPLLIIAAVIGLLGAIGFIVVAFSLYDLINPREPLGLPEGSVRALIALLILVIFAAMTIFFFGALRAKPAEGADPVGVSAAADLSKQVLTVLGTLLTAISSFYFGSQSATTAATKATTAAMKPPSGAGGGAAGGGSGAGAGGGTAGGGSGGDESPMRSGNEKRSIEWSFDPTEPRARSGMSEAE